MAVAEERRVGVNAHKLPHELSARLTRMIRRVRVILLTRGLLAVAAVAVGAVLAVMAIDAAVVLVHPASRWAFSMAGLALVAATAWSMLVLPLARPLSLTRMARVLETRHPDMQERISSAIELAGHGGVEAEHASGELIALLTQDAKRDLAGVQPRQEFTVRTVKPFLMVTACVLAVLGILFAVWPKQSWLLFLRAVAPHREFDTLQASVLEVRPGDIMQLAQTPVRFEVTAPERHGLRAEILFRRTDGHRTIERMKRLSAQGADPVVFELELPSVAESFEYRVRYGNGITRPYSVVIMTEPGLSEIRVSYTYPAYTGLQPTQQVGVAQEIAAVAGTRIRIESAFDRACEAALRINDLTFLNPAGVATNGTWLQTMTARRNGRWTLALRDACGFTNQPVWSALTALPDRPPEVSLVMPEASRLTLPPYDRLVCNGTVSDDYGLGQMELVLRSEKAGERGLPLTATRRCATQAVLEGAPDLQALYDQGVRSFKLFLRVADNLPAELGGPQVRESRMVSVTLDYGARTLREQVREATRKEVEERLRKAAHELNEAANRVAQEKGTFDKPELTEKAVEKLEQARASTVKAEELMEAAARATERSPFALFAKEILDTRDEQVEPAFQKLEQIPLAEADKRKQVGEETESAFREAANKVNDLVNRVLQEENRRQEAQSRLAELAQREEMLAEKAETSKMDKQAMQEWANRQNEAEQKVWQSKPELEDAAFNQALERVRQARETMLQAERAVTPEADQALRREEDAAKKAARAADLAEQAAEQALLATEKAEEVADTRAASDAAQAAAEKTSTAAEKAAQAAQEAQQAAQKRAANEGAADAAERKAVAERAVQAAQQAARAAETAAQAAEQARQAADARRAGQKEQAASAEKQAGTQTEAAAADARKANAEAGEAVRQAEVQRLDIAAAAGQLAAESASFTQRAAELAQAAADQSAAAAKETEGAPMEKAAKEAQGLAEQARQVAAEAKAKAVQASERAQEQLAQLAQEALAAAARQTTAPGTTVTEQAQQAVEHAREAVDQAKAAVAAARQTRVAAQDTPPLEQAMAEQLAQAAALAEQAGKWAEQSGERTGRAEAAELGDARERAETRQALSEAQAAAQLAAEAAALAQRSARQMATALAERKQVASEAAQAAAQQAGVAAKEAELAAKLSKGMARQDVRQASEQSRESSRLTGEAAALAHQALQTAAQATAAADEQAEGQAQAGQAKARQAVELARNAKAQATSRAAADRAQAEAASLARQVADVMANAVEAQAKRETEAWAQAQGRLGGTLRRVAAGGGSGGAEPTVRVQLNQDWIRFRGEVGSEAYEEMLKKTPAEYRDLVKQYFEELSREGQDTQK